MRLLDGELKDKSVWEKAGIELPGFDREVMKAETAKCPQWVHFGAGNIFRAFPAALQQKLLNEGVEKTGIIAVSYTHLDVYKRQALHRSTSRCSRRTVTVIVREEVRKTRFRR